MSEIGELLIKNIRELARLKPEFIYDKDKAIGKCLYVHKGQPSCLVGHALWNAGIIGTDLEKSWNNGQAFDMFASGMGLDSDERHWLEEVQNQQDGGASWSSAVDRADGYV